jgi:hypothetical protein
MSERTRKREVRSIEALRIGNCDGESINEY